jgi:hypothetical protein
MRRPLFCNRAFAGGYHQYRLTGTTTRPAPATAIAGVFDLNRGNPAILILNRRLLAAACLLDTINHC